MHDQPFTPVCATHVVVDTTDGWTFWKDENGKLFNEQSATAFAEARNAEMKPQYRSYKVFRLEA